MSEMPKHTKNLILTEVKEEVYTEPTPTTNTDDLLLQRIEALETATRSMLNNLSEKSKEDGMDLEPPRSKRRKHREITEATVHSHYDPNRLENLPPLKLVIVTAEEVEKEKKSGRVFGRKGNSEFNPSAIIKKREDRPFHNALNTLSSWEGFQELVSDADAQFRVHQITPLRVAYYLAQELRLTPFAPFLTSKDGYEILRNMQSEERFQPLSSRFDRRTLVENLTRSKNSATDLFATLAKVNLVAAHRDEFLLLSAIALGRAISEDESLNKAATFALPKILQLLTIRGNPKEVGNAACLFQTMWLMCDEMRPNVTSSTPTLLPTAVVRDSDSNYGADGSNQNANRKQRNRKRRRND